MAHPGGRPLFYPTPAELEAKVVDYFNNPPRTRVISDKEGKKIAEVPILTITGLILHLGFCDRQSFYDYEARPEFSHIIKKARSLIELEYEELLQKGLGAGAIFGLKNFGWTDRTEHEHSGRIDSSVSIKISPDKGPDEQGD